MSTKASCLELHDLGMIVPLTAPDTPHADDCPIVCEIVNIASNSPAFRSHVLDARTFPAAIALYSIGRFARSVDSRGSMRFWTRRHQEVFSLFERVPFSETVSDVRVTHDYFVPRPAISKPSIMALDKGKVSKKAQVGNVVGGTLIPARRGIRNLTLARKILA